MKYTLLFFAMVWSLYSCQSLYYFKNQFKKEVAKIKPEIADKALEKIINKVAKTYTMEWSHTIKAVDLSNILKTCHLDFEINLVQSPVLPASDHLIAHIIVGGVIIPGQEQVKRKNDLWRGQVGVAIKYGNIPNTVHILTYDLGVHFDKQSFEQKAGTDLSSIDDHVLADAIFYNTLLSIIEKEIEPIKVITNDKDSVDVKIDDNIIQN